MQNLSYKKIRIHLNNLLLDSRFWENISSFHPNDREKIKRAYLQRCSCQPLSHDFPKKKKKKLVVYCVDLNLISLKNTKYWLDHIIKKDDAFCLYGYLFRQDVGNWKGD